MRVVRAAGAEPAGTAKVFLSVYGGYGVPYVSTSYESWQRAWLEAGGVLAYAGVRGGSEYGEQWHQAGTRHNKQRGIDDLIACVSWFEENGWSEPKSVVINGMSNGGLMVSTVIVQRPELLGGAVPEVAVIDMLNFHKYTAAHGWIREYGDPENPEDRAMLASYSPLHNVADVEYPPC
jgi:prolyl oligopeptidase